VKREEQAGLGTGPGPPVLVKPVKTRQNRQNRENKV